MNYLNVGNVNLTSSVKFSGIGRRNTAYIIPKNNDFMDADYVVLESKNETKKGFLGRLMDVFGRRSEDNIDADCDSDSDTDIDYDIDADMEETKPRCNFREVVLEQQPKIETKKSFLERFMNVFGLGKEDNIDVDLCDCDSDSDTDIDYDIDADMETTSRK